MISHFSMALLFLAFSIEAHRTPNALAIRFVLVRHTSLAKLTPCTTVIRSEAGASYYFRNSHVDSDYIFALV
jgi:hypothetical protein